MPKIEDVQVTQGDREAALSTSPLGSRERYRIQQGKGDHYPIVQRFARRRLEALEEAAKMIETMPSVIEFSPRDNQSLHEATREKIASAIRNLKGPK